MTGSVTAFGHVSAASASQITAALRRIPQAIGDLGR
jgi:hypothetical protein